MDTLERRLRKMSGSLARLLLNTDLNSAWRGKQESQGLGVGALSVGVGRREELCDWSNVQKFPQIRALDMAAVGAAPEAGPSHNGGVACEYDANRSRIGMHARGGKASRSMRVCLWFMDSIKSILKKRAPGSLERATSFLRLIGESDFFVFRSFLPLCISSKVITFLMSLGGIVTCANSRNASRSHWSFSFATRCFTVCDDPSPPLDLRVLMSS